MLFDPASKIVSEITIGYSFLVSAGILSIRFFNKRKSADADKGTRRQMPRLRYFLNVMLLAALTGVMALIGWDVLSFLKFEDAPAYVRFTIGFSTVCIWLLIMVMAFMRFTNKTKGPRVEGQERRRFHGLRKALHFLIVASVVVMCAIALYGLLR